ncbi:MAG: hypothetical protein JNM78_14770 [Cyclobacteriaceae bacterium]|nr:hypothetical protein [Cyclobacteriaceae bacterium]
MKILILSCLLILMLAACKDDAVEITSAGVTYEVLTTSGNWYGEYIDETGKKICFCSQPLPVGGWTHSFAVSTKPFTLHIDGTTECVCMGQMGAPDVTTNIYVNKKLVATNTSNWAPGNASADFVIE